MVKRLMAILISTGFIIARDGLVCQNCGASAPRNFVFYVTFTTIAAPEGLLDFFKSIFCAQTFEQARTKTKQGYGAAVHGKININGKSFDFVFGGRGRGSAPFGTYGVGTLSGFRTPRGAWIPGYQLTDAYDPFEGHARRPVHSSRKKRLGRLRGDPI
jgi:hypothetical protein